MYIIEVFIKWLNKRQTKDSQPEKPSFEDIDEALRLGMEMSIEDLNRRGIEPHTDTMEALLWYTRAVQEN